MPWLVRDGKVLATLEVATSLRDRTRGLLGRDGIDGAILLRPAKSVHSFRMRFAIDVAFCDSDLRVLKVTTLARNRITRPVRRAHSVIESEAGTMGRWGIRAGDQLDIRGLDDPAVGAGARSNGGPAAAVTDGSTADLGSGPKPRTASTSPTASATSSSELPAPGSVDGQPSPPSDRVIDVRTESAIVASGGVGAVEEGPRRRAPVDGDGAAAAPVTGLTDGDRGRG